MRLTDLQINESLDSAVKYKKRTEQDGLSVYRFTVDNNTFQVTFKASGGSDGFDWTGTTKLVKRAKRGDVPDPNKRKVLSTFVEITIDFLKSQQPQLSSGLDLEVLLVSANGNKMNRVSQLFSRSFKKGLPNGYKLESVDTGTPIGRGQNFMMNFNIVITSKR